MMETVECFLDRHAFGPQQLAQAGMDRVVIGSGSFFLRLVGLVRNDEKQKPAGLQLAHGGKCTLDGAVIGGPTGSLPFAAILVIDILVYDAVPIEKNRLG